MKTLLRGESSENNVALLEDAVPPRKKGKGASAALPARKRRLQILPLSPNRWPAGP